MAKPIFVVYYPCDRFASSDDYNSLVEMIAEIYDMLSEEYHVIHIPSRNALDIDFKLFCDKTFSEEKIAEIQQYFKENFFRLAEKYKQQKQLKTK